MYAFTVQIITFCPQCKNHIKFKVKRFLIAPPVPTLVKPNTTNVKNKKPNNNYIINKMRTNVFHHPLDPGFLTWG